MFNLYHLLSPRLKLVAQHLGLATGRCRFTPTCSLYAKQAITTHGFLRGTLLAVKRMLKCHPGNPGGLDPVPPPRSPNPEKTKKYV